MREHLNTGSPHLNTIGTKNSFAKQHNRQMKYYMIAKTYDPISVATVKGITHS